MSAMIAFIGFGEAGQTISRGLLGETPVRLRTYDILLDDPANAGKLKRAAEQLGANPARDHADAVRDAEIVFLAVTASSSLAAARSAMREAMDRTKTQEAPREKSKRKPSASSNEIEDILARTLRAQAAHP